MLNLISISKSITKILVICAPLLSVSQASFADRIRHCNYAFNAQVKILNSFEEVVRSEVLFIGGQAAGKHGGVQANTARERARERIKSCLKNWISLDRNLSSFEISTCTNQNISGVAGFDIETSGRSLREEIAETLPDLCDSHRGNEVQVIVDNARLLVTGDNRCPSTLNLPRQDLLVGAFCQGL
ncbi:hypothetical protein [Pseudobacteriovorax antillogorgiicola]|uniref:Uncharacterized protein n=1 Tax=Pseudobacteriovorax antillogorgiicola TaxID=1513793 RepID=A0A1Y6BZ38_9BACT|nr:hypothetical protein [Pseudobacteriovorax antillogorgiicola]TCS52966.1 hypothetical protein EDD56_10817 [Pseudobacteriovorax antillogorgiicola]SMF27478.1 hypothetical protein SAMN06296036_108230 [Pseudobacteriovorax antillogorgiicola]